MAEKDILGQWRRANPLLSPRWVCASEGGLWWWQWYMLSVCMESNPAMESWHSHLYSNTVDAQDDLGCSPPFYQYTLWSGTPSKFHHVPETSTSFYCRQCQETSSLLSLLTLGVAWVGLFSSMSLSHLTSMFCIVFSDICLLSLLFTHHLWFTWQMAHHLKH